MFVEYTPRRVLLWSHTSQSVLFINTWIFNFQQIFQTTESGTMKKPIVKAIRVFFTIKRDCSCSLLFLGGPGKDLEVKSSLILASSLIISIIISILAAEINCIPIVRRLKASRLNLLYIRRDIERLSLCSLWLFIVVEQFMEPHWMNTDTGNAPVVWLEEILVGYVEINIKMDGYANVVARNGNSSSNAPREI